ncbi:hypothetical protein BCR33DRAFT_741460 [Rhizoclosmatium globosum]|uniref:Uncharacterized protein n=1 Tax=Rhizoclosmatium globosum TaxID=329046 RepID=A0A1Y2BV23_9FUNG|nr:hypothetical protein BCR33DRAFT_741460 [Rhizoclosmatium globosum]|eukprot:ORY38596.1 hypothetical protein BCR33DRAFT_741460 [Rhizoclosmatium globosum]
MSKLTPDWSETQSFLFDCTSTLGSNPASAPSFFSGGEAGLKSIRKLYHHCCPSTMIGPIDSHGFLSYVSTSNNELNWLLPDKNENDFDMAECYFDNDDNESMDENNCEKPDGETIQPELHQMNTEFETPEKIPFVVHSSLMAGINFSSFLQELPGVCTN